MYDSVLSFVTQMLLYVLVLLYIVLGKRHLAGSDSEDYALNKDDDTEIGNK
jgi:hypothetical protein